jgi:hypothetical protein
VYVPPVLAVVAVIALSLLLGRLSTQLVRRVGDWVSQINFGSAFIGVVLTLLLLFGVQGPDQAVIALIGLVVFTLAMVWYREFRILMQQDDSVFPGRYDKIIWAFLLIVLPPVGVLTFHAFRKAHLPEPKPVEPAVAREWS